MNNNPIIKPEFVPNPFKHFCMTIGYIPTSYKDSLDYYEQLLWLIKFLENTVIPAVDNNAAAVTELQQFYLQLQSYVNNYFDNLDVQEEINNKLDEMVEDGTIQNILLNYASVQKIYNTAVEMIEDSENIVSGMHIKTLGYYEINDTGGADYYVSSTPYATTHQGAVFENASIPIHDSLYINLIKNSEVSIAQLGAEANTDITTLLQNAINIYRNVLVPRNEYIISSTIDIPWGGNLHGVHRRYSILKFTGTGFAVSVKYGSQICDMGIDCTAGTYTQDNDIMGEISTSPILVQTWTRNNVSGIELIPAHSIAKRCEVSNASLYGFRPDTYCELIDCLATNCKYSYAPLIDNTITGCIAQMCEVAIYLDHAFTNQLRNMRVDECGKHFIYITGGSGNIIDLIGGQAYQSGIVMNASAKNKITGIISRCAQISRGKAWENSNTPLDDYAICETGYCANNEYDITLNIGDSYAYNNTTHSYFPKRILAAVNSYNVYKVLTEFPTANDTIVTTFGNAYNFDFSPYFNIDYARATIYLNQIKLSFNGSDDNGYYINDIADNQPNKGLGNYIRCNSGKVIIGANGTEYKITPDIS